MSKISEQTLHQKRFTKLMASLSVLVAQSCPTLYNPVASRGVQRCSHPM